MSGSATLDFDDHVVLVTGAAGALGGAVVETFLDAGATVAGVDIAPLEEAVGEDGLPESVTYLQADLTDEAAVIESAQAVINEHDSLDVLCNIAGTWRGGDPIHETDEQVFDMLFDINLRTMFLTSKHALPHLIEQEGTIVSVAARSALEGGAGDGIYRASKAGVKLLTETIAEEQLGTVRANAVMPSVLDTPMNREMMTPSDDWVEPSEIAAVIALLCTEETAVTSGASIPVYGTA